MLISGNGRACVVVAVALAGWITLGPAVGQEPKKITIGISSNSLALSSARIAEELGLYKKHGLDAKITALDSASMATSALIGGSLDFACVNPTDAVLAKTRGQDLVVLRSLYSGFPAVVIISKAAADKAGVAATAPLSQRMKALDGLVVATPSATSSYTVSLKATAEAEGANLRFTYMALPSMVSALQTGNVQAIVASSPFYVAPLLAGTGVIWLNGPQNEYPPKYSLSNSVTLITTRAFATENADTIRRANEVFADLGKIVQDRPADIKGALAKLYPDVDARSLDLILEAELKSFIGKESTVEDMARTIDFVKLSGIAVPNELTPNSLLKN